MVIAGRFSVERAASAGGMGRIYEGIDLLTGQPAAIKLMTPTVKEKHDAERFTREAEMLADLQHPGIVKYIAHGLTENGGHYLAMEWLHGQDLHRFLESGTLGIGEVMLLARQVADALAAAHQRGIVHRDLKPSNLFLVDGDLGKVKLIDFGVARAARARTLTQTGAVVGTPTYMAPEQARGERDIGPAVDIFSLGCIFYECMAGRPPFVADHMAAVLAKILFEEAEPIWGISPLVPACLGELLMRMLSKAPAQRPRDAAALGAELDRVVFEVGQDAPAARPRRPRAEAITDREQVLVSVVVARMPDNPSGITTGTDLGAALVRDPPSGPLRLEQLGVQVEALADGSIVATSRQPGNATDQARAAARCALFIRERIPEAMVSLATGRGHRNELGYAPVGEAIDRAVQLLHYSPPTLAMRGPTTPPIEGVITDELTAALLDSRFVIHASGEHRILGAERVAVDDTRLLLGRPTPCVGREHELALLEMNLARCVEDSYPYAILVVAPPGVGKSRLRHEFLRRIDGMERGQGSGPRPLCLFGRGDSVIAGSPYGLLGQAIRQLFGAQPGDAPELLQQKLRERVSRHLAPADAPRVVEFIGEMCGVPFADADSPQLRAARQDPKVMSDQVSTALIELFRAECAANPVLIVLEDLHWSDGLTVKLIEVLLRELVERPFLVLALARPEVYEAFPNLFAVQASVIQLRGISAKPCARLVREVLGDRVDAETTTRIVQQAAGNALFLEELIRAVAEGKGERLPDTVLAILQSRMSRLDTDTRRLLRAAAIFGVEFWKGGIAVICGGQRPDELDESLRIAVEQELIERVKESRFPGESQYAFRHALMRDAAYSLLTDSDRKVGHRLAALYLEKLGEPDPAVLADHLEKGGEPKLAVPKYIRAADLAAAGNDLAATMRHVERGLACKPDGEDLGSLRGLLCYVSFWNDRWEAAYPPGSAAMEHLVAGSFRWCKTMGTLLTITSLSGKLEHFGKLVTAFGAAEPADDARTAYVEAASMLVTMFSYLARRPQAEKLRARMEEVGALAGPSDATAQGWIRQAQVYFARGLEADPWRTLQIAEEGCREFERAHSTRNQIILQNFLGLAQAELGALEAGEATLRGALAVAQRLKESLALMRSMVCLATLLTRSLDPAKRDEAFALASETVATRGVNSVYLGMAHDVLAQVHFGRGDVEAAEAEARRSMTVVQALPVLRLHASATLVRALLARNAVDEARAVAEAGLVTAGELGGVGFAEVELLLAAVQARLAAGDREAARAALAEALRQIGARAELIPDAGWRRRYLEEVAENARARALGAEWGVGGV